MSNPKRKRNRRPHILIHVEDGIVQSVDSPIPLDFTVLDYDFEGSEDLVLIPLDGERKTVLQHSDTAQVNPDRIEQVLHAIEKPCQHNTMIRTDSKALVWKCAECGYVYGATLPEPPKQA